MNTTALQLLEEIGNQLNSGQFPCVRDGGTVMPGNVTISYDALGKEKKDGSGKASTRSSTGSRKWTTSRKGSSRQRRQTRNTSQVFNAKVRKDYLRDVKRLTKAYPSTRAWDTPHGLWTLVKTLPIAESNRPATFLVFLPYGEELPLRAWGFWSTVLGHRWIGPRHTNHPDGTICAYEPDDQTWLRGDRLIKLIDIYCVWAARHLYLERFGLWPGYQAVHHAYERLTEIHDDEYCGCDLAGRRYADCCKPDDLKLDRSQIQNDFESKYGTKEVPEVVIDFVCGKGPLPQIKIKKS